MDNKKEVYDFNNKELNIGDIVVFIDGRAMTKGMITGFGKHSGQNTVKIFSEKNKTGYFQNYTRQSKNVSKVSTNDEIERGIEPFNVIMASDSSDALTLKIKDFVRECKDSNYDFSDIYTAVGMICSKAFTNASVTHDI